MVGGFRGKEETEWNRRGKVLKAKIKGGGCVYLGRNKPKR